jgi:hypothetical protein
MYTDIPTSSGIVTHDPSIRAGEDRSCLRPYGHCDRLRWIFIDTKKENGNFVIIIIIITIMYAYMYSAYIFFLRVIASSFEILNFITVQLPWFGLTLSVCTCARACYITGTWAVA